MKTPSHVVLVNGNVGTGKTTVSEDISACLGYDVFSKDEIRRELDKSYNGPDIDVLRELDKRVSYSLEAGCGVVIDSTYKTGSGRQHVYDVAAAYERPAVVVECYCPENLAKSRISTRRNDKFNLHLPSDPAVYDRIKSKWENVTDDFCDGKNPHVSYLRYDSEFGDVEIVLLRKGSVNFVDHLADILERVPRWLNDTESWRR